MPKDKDDHSQLTCTAWFAGELKASKTVTVYIKRKESYNYAIIPAVVGIGTAAIIGVVCLFILKKYRRRISELQNQDGSMWNRLSRLSRRTRSVSPGSSCSDQRTRHKKPKIRSVQKAPKPRFPSPEWQQSEQNSNKEVLWH
ncbi:unnamed protein product [Tetraodon nigroviridis]|uniref:(spotted green pufferfish) hypothetical protein n=1 Tax=Tetraodon nigroviridis TaxID=99883 RepID=Q4SH12_TETNG|nr:unnamed protein product [Tetraodon nigroviridis]